MSLRIYLGNLDPRVQQSELEDECRKFGKTTNVWVARNPPGFAFIEFDDLRDAEDAVKGLDNLKIGQQAVKAEFARSKNKTEGGGGRPMDGGGGRGGDGGGDRDAGSRPPPRPGRHRAILKNLPASFSWKELKDEMRRIGDVIYADVASNGDGVVEFGSIDDLDYAVRKLDGSKLDGHVIQVFRDGDSGGGGRGYGERGGAPPPARYDERDRYEARDDRRGYDDRRYDDRRESRGGGGYEDRRYREDDRDDRRPPPPRYEERAPPPRAEYGRQDDYRDRGRNDRYND